MDAWTCMATYSHQCNVSYIYQTISSDYGSYTMKACTIFTIMSPNNFQFIKTIHTSHKSLLPSYNSIVSNTIAIIGSQLDSQDQITAYIMKQMKVDH